MPGPAFWSTDPASNDVSDPAVFLVEGQDPPSLNNACRAIMAGGRAAYLDGSGKAVASGVAGNALALTTEQSITAAQRVDGFTVAFRVTGANSGPVTLNVDGTGAKPLRRAGNLELAPGDLAPFTVYSAVYVADPGVYLIVTPAIERPGRIAAFGSLGAIPPGWVECDGASLSRTAFSALFDAIGITFGGSGTTFNVPDINGRTIFGRDNSKGRLTSAGGLTGNVGDTGGSATVALTVAQLPNFTPNGTVAAGGARDATTTGADGGRPATTTGGGGAHTPSGSADNVSGHTHNGTATASSGHAHGYKTASIKNGFAGSGSTNGPFWGGADTDVATDTANPTLNITTTSAGGHGHGLSMDAVPNHTHPVASVPDHTHPVAAVPAHTHPLNMDPIGSGAAHANTPPGLVAVWAIKA